MLKTPAVPLPSDVEPSALAHASLCRSRTRRVAAWTDARRTHIRRTRVLALVAGVAAVAGAAGAQERTGGEPARATAPKAAVALLLVQGATGPAVEDLQRALSIPADGSFGPVTTRAVRRAQRRAGLTVDGVVGPATRAALGLGRPATAPAAAPEEKGGGEVLARIARCESGGDPTAVSPDGRYRGKYQFSRATWRALGGKGDPARAPEAEQDARAADLLARDGTTPWPSCGA